MNASRIIASASPTARRRAPGTPRLAELAAPLVTAVVAFGLAACGGAPPKVASREPVPAVPAKSGEPAVAKRGGAYYLDDGPGENPPPNLDALADAVPKLEALRPASNRPYEVFGRTYTPLTTIKPYREKGVASWYGRRYHGKPTSSGEIYDMYGMTAAHPTLPIPSYARVTNLKTSRTVVVRVNDRGPFLHNRVIDLSYAAAYRIGTLAGGSGLVEVELVVPGNDATRKNPAALAERGVVEPPRPATIASNSSLSRSDAETRPQQIATAGAAFPRSEAPGPRTAGETLQQPAVLTEVSGAKGLFLQLGAFSGKDNAEGFLTRVKGQAGDVPGVLEVFLRDGLYRVQSGPYASDGDARQAAERLASRLGVKVIVTAR